MCLPVRLVEVRPAQEFETGVMRRSVRGAGVSGASAGVHVGTGAEANCEVRGRRTEARQAARWGPAAASLQVQVARRGRRRDRRRAGARRRLLFRYRSRGARGGEARGALGFGGGFTSGPGRAARAEARRGARWGSAAASLEVQVRRAARAEARQAARWGSAAASLEVQVARRGRRRDRRAGARRRLHLRSRSRGADGGETGGALGLGGGFSSGTGLAARAEARRGARWGSAADSRQVQVALRGRRRGAGRAGARRRLQLRSRSRGAGGGETGGALGLGGGFTSGPGLAARAEARQAARWGSAAASLEVQVSRRGRR
eukprot:tig00000147_g9438.t2